MIKLKALQRYVYITFQAGSEVTCQTVPRNVSEITVRVKDPENVLYGVSMTTDIGNAGLQWQTCVYYKHAGKNLLNKHDYITINLLTKKLIAPNFSNTMNTNGLKCLQNLKHNLTSTAYCYCMLYVIVKLLFSLQYIRASFYQQQVIFEKIETYTCRCSIFYFPLQIRIGSPRKCLLKLVPMTTILS